MKKKTEVWGLVLAAIGVAATLAVVPEIRSLWSPDPELLPSASARPPNNDAQAPASVPLETNRTPATTLVLPSRGPTDIPPNPKPNIPDALPLTKNTEVPATPVKQSRSNNDDIEILAEYATFRQAHLVIQMAARMRSTALDTPTADLHIFAAYSVDESGTRYDLRYQPLGGWPNNYQVLGLRGSPLHRLKHGETFRFELAYRKQYPLEPTIDEATTKLLLYLEDSVAPIEVAVRR